MRTVVPVAIGPVTTKLPSVIALTLPATLSGLPLSPIAGMSTLPPNSSVTSLPTPALIICSTEAGSQIGPATASSRPCFIASSITLITSCVPPEAVLSPWSAITTGPPSSDLARATWTDSGSGWNRKPSRFSQAVSRILLSSSSPSAVRLSQTITEDSARCGMSACGKPPNTEAFSTWPESSAWLAMPIRVFIGSRDGVWTSELLMIGRFPHTILGSTSPSSMRSKVRPARRAVSAMSMCG